MVNRTIVGAHYGLAGWLVQRISAVVIAVYAIALTGFLMSGDPINYPGWKSLFSQGWMRVATLVFVLSLLAHAWIGIRDILMDYIKHTGLRLTLEILFVLGFIVCGGWALQILWRS